MHMVGGLFRSKRLWAAVLVVAVMLAASLWPEAIDVELASAATAPLEVTVEEEGETRVREPFTISAPVAGRLQRIVLEPGDGIERARTVLARLAPADPTLLDPRTRAEFTAAAAAARAALGQARAERDRAAATLKRAASTLGRQQELEAGGLVSRDELEAARLAHRSAEEALRAAEFTVARAEHDLRMAQARVQEPSAGGRMVEIRAPIDGVVLKRFRESEGVVPAGEPLMEVGDPADLEVIADLLSSDAVRVSPGDPVRIEQWGGGRPLEGRVRRVEPSGFMKISALGVEEQRVNVLIDFVSHGDATRELGDGYRVEIRIIVWQQDQVLTVPIGAIFRRGNDWAVFAVRNGRAEVRTVEVGQRNTTTAQVLKGLSAGDTVVVHPPDALSDGSKVRARGA
jgi:HlyD family secretion protein